MQLSTGFRLSVSLCEKSQLYMCEGESVSVCVWMRAEGLKCVFARVLSGACMRHVCVHWFSRLKWLCHIGLVQLSKQVWKLCQYRCVNYVSYIWTSNFDSRSIPTFSVVQKSIFQMWRVKKCYDLYISIYVTKQICNIDYVNAFVQNMRCTRYRAIQIYIKQ